MSFTLPDLPYASNALEPHIDKTTMEIHHGKHHAGYVNNLNKAIAGTPLEKQSLEDLLKHASKNPVAVRNNAGGHWNHSFFWPQMGPKAGGTPSGKLAEAINEAFGSFDNFKAEFAKAAGSRFGSGWAWLGVNKDGSLGICSTPNQDNPLMDVVDTPCTPILGIDVWEHAYYLKYQNRRGDYVNAFWNLVRWDVIADRYKKAKE